MKKINLLSFLWPQIIYQIDSPFNGTIYVKEFLGDRYLEIGGLTQSGDVLTSLFKGAFHKLNLKKFLVKPKQILVLGVGGGSVIKLFAKYFPHAMITGIDVDPVILKLAEDYFDVKPSEKLQLKVGDVFSKEIQLGANKDLIFVDIFRGYHVPENLGSAAFLSRLKKSLTNEGVVIFNHLYDKNVISEADKFLDKVEKIFEDVTTTQVNLNLFIKAC